MQYYKQQKSWKKKKQNDRRLKPTIEKASEPKLATGVAVNTRINNRTSSTYLGDISDYSDSNLNDRHKVVELARKLRNREGVCSTVADLLIDFGVTRGRFYSDNYELKTLLNRWSSYVNSPPGLNTKGLLFPVPGIRLVSRKLLDDYLTDGDSVFTLFWQKGIKINQGEKGKGYFLPISIRALDTTMLKVDEDLAKFGIEQLVLELGSELKKRILNPKTDADKFLVKTISPEWVKMLRKKEDIILDPNVTYHIKRNPKDYKPWGESLFIKAFTSIATKRRIQAVDEATIEGIINRFTIFKIGLPDAEKNKAYHIPSSSRVQALIDIVQNPKRANAAVWPGPDLEIEDIGPDGKILEFIDKYKQVDADILRSLHVSPLLIDGTSSGQAIQDWSAFISTEVGLDAIRDELEKIYSQIGKDIAIANKMKYEQVYYKFDTQLLKDEKRVRNFALKVYELGGMSTETFVETMGYNFETEKRLKEKEVDDGISDIFINRSIPYQGNPVPENDTSVPKNDTVVPEGKPIDPKEDGEDNLEVASEKFDNTDFYYKEYHRLFEKIINEIEAKKHVSKKDFSAIEISLISGFSTFKSLTDSQIFDLYKKYVSTTKGDYYKRLLNWNSKHVDSFYAQMRAELLSSFSDTDLFNTVLNKQDYRLHMYATEIVNKVIFVSKNVEAKKKGYTKGKWSAVIDDKTCDVCISNDGNVYGIDNLFDIYPAHPGCRCDIIYTK